ncbi:hypothetical protein DH2020_028508 [Rehmannia glutinosa]|uniref:Uncharacterized protein n=1 Tax=Rehmannia glutinosa TaxID=99300 RepID=A0ABR0VU86_REHGL
MGFESKKALLYSDLFKCDREKEEETIVRTKTKGSSWSSSSNQSSPCGSSSSGFSTPLYSDLGSSESFDDGDFIAELTRQMAERMLQDEDEDEDEEKDTVGNSSVKNNNLKNGSNSGPASVDDRIPPIQVYELKNKSPVRNCRERVKVSESAQQKQFQKTEHHYMQYRGREWGVGRGRKGYSGSGMQAVFLGGSGSRTGSTGTGVFLPRVTSDPTELKKKPGCSMVLMPTRVLQALELHFNRRHNSAAPPLGGRGSPNHSCPKDESTISNGHSQLENQSTNYDEMQLPQEWTY